MNFSNGIDREKPQQPGRHFILWSRGIAREKQFRLPVMVNDWPGQTFKLRMAAAKIFLSIIRTRASEAPANRTLAVSEKLLFLPGPSAFRAFHPFVNAGDENFKRNL